MRLNKEGNSRILLILAHLGAMITVIFWATSFLSTKVLMERGGFTPVEMYVYRFTLAYILLLCLTFKHIMCRSWKDELTLFVSGICAGSLYFVTENYALTLTSAGNVSLLVSTSPLFTALFVALLYRQKVKVGVWIGSAVAMIGVALVILSNGTGLDFHPEGDLLALAASLCWGIYSVAVRRVIPLYSSLFITRKLFFYGVITALPLLLLQKGPTHLALLFDFNHLDYMLNFLYLVCMCSVAAYLIWNETMKSLGSVMANNYLYLQAPVTMVAGYLFLGEHIFLMGYIGCLFVVGGLVISDKLKK